MKNIVVSSCAECPFSKTETDMSARFYTCVAPGSPEGYSSVIDTNRFKVPNPPNWCPLRTEPFTVVSAGFKPIPDFKCVRCRKKVAEYQYYECDRCYFSRVKEHRDAGKPGLPMRGSQK